ncbi:MULTISPECIES: CopD family protein [Lysobacteraceae]|uniref:Protoporphyrinogen IX oxidase n=1 Tax=Luteimonas padinae TaxID=1714359 RepID=A0ABV6SUF0_9GAMM|nr:MULTISPECIES: CopD family protein [Xanthomonadaceae]MCR1806932.1 CopD family protein [Stenotrophomonas geniculata]KZE52511.1 hypothetical protein AVW14_10350 [Stenotrophomonas maltophilia]MCA0094442.1 CopD family protein [Stenotrophomonas maltophilia]MCO5737787.1 CopD family protein [Stenotrophomonas maltophilia]MCU1032048.1 CopD family protein [Stenotrophomonas maltophilia]
MLYLPRILVNLAEAGEHPAVRERLVLMGRRLSRFGHVLFGIALLMGLTLWLHFGFAGGWLHAKLLLVTLVFVFSIVIGRWLKAAEAGRPLPSARALRWINEIPLVLLVGIVYLVVGKPF